jgi:putative ABC transport system substrate-binding protein
VRVGESPRLRWLRGLPTVCGYPAHVASGGLVSYGVDLLLCFHRCAYFVDRILRGTSPADLPVEFPTKLLMVINLETAKALGITLSPVLTSLADQLLE